MNADHVLETLNAHSVAYLLVGGVNFLLRHKPVLTYDIDVWIEDTRENLGRCERALSELQAEWGADEQDWAAVAERAPGWLAVQGVFCLTSPHGAIDVFRFVKGLDSWSESRARAFRGLTAGGVGFLGLSDEDMLRCQMALPEGSRNTERIRLLQQALGHTEEGTSDG